jgi:hypothetical protein
MKIFCSTFIALCFALNAYACAVTTSKHDATCFSSCNGSASATAVGVPPFSYSWLPGGQTTASISNLCAGTYTVTVHDALNCTATAIVNITAPTEISISPTAVNTSCYGSCDGAAYVMVSGGIAPYTYQWSDGTTSPVITNKCAGTYSIVVTDSRGCQKSATNLVIGQPAALNVSIAQTNVSCTDLCDGSATASASGGTSPYSYAWQHDTSAPAAITNLCPAGYTVIVTDAHGCTATQSVLITEPEAISVMFSYPVQPTCNGDCDGSLSGFPIGGTSPYSFYWSSGVFTPTITNQCAGVKQLTIRDANGCEATSMFYLSEPTMTLSLTTTFNCHVEGPLSEFSYGACANLYADANGGAQPYDYTWSNGEISESAQACTGGMFSCTITDNNGCTLTDSVFVESHPVQAINSYVTNASCSDVCDGSASVDYLESATYSWFNIYYEVSDSNTNSISNACPTNFPYVCTVTNEYGCTNYVMLFIGPDSAYFNIETTGSDSGCNGTAKVTDYYLGWNHTLEYLWQPGGETTDSIGNLCTGSYTVTVSEYSETFEGFPVLLTCTTREIEITNGARYGSETTALQSGPEIYPNPATSTLNIQLDPNTTGPTTVVITNALGQVALETQLISVSTQQYALDISLLPSGAYYITITTAGAPAVRQLIKE